MTDLNSISARQLSLSLSSYRKTLLATRLPEAQRDEMRAKVTAIRAELNRRGVTVSRLP